MIYADCESILVREDNRKQNPNESYTNKYQKPVACSYGYKLVCVDHKFSKLLNHTLVKMLFTFSLILCMIEESKYYNEVMKKHFNKKLVMIKQDN